MLGDFLADDLTMIRQRHELRTKRHVASVGKDIPKRMQWMARRESLLNSLIVSLRRASIRRQQKVIGLWVIIVYECSGQANLAGNPPCSHGRIPFQLHESLGRIQKKRARDGGFLTHSFSSQY